MSATVLAGPFEIRRCVDNATVVRSEIPLATTSVGPYDDSVGVLGDGQTYFYVVDDSAGDPVQLSVHKNTGQNTVRLGFGDGQPTSADADAIQSSVTVSPATIPADGVAAAVILVVPRDASGVLLGAGLELTVDNGRLFPGFPSGPVVDHGNGSYTVSVISWSAGFGDAIVTAEGVTLNDEPQLTYEYAEPEGLDAVLIEIAEELQDIADVSNGGVSQELEDTVEELYDAIDELFESPSDFEHAISEVANAFEELEKAEAEGLSGAVAAEYRERLAEISRRIAVEAIHAAIVAGVDPSELEDSYSSLDEGDDKFAEQDFNGAMDKYEDAAAHAEDAMP